jgi:hypothetical protein
LLPIPPSLFDDEIMNPSIVFVHSNLAMKHWIIAASAGYFGAMHHLRILFEKGAVSRESIDSTLTAYNACAEF